MKVRITMEFTPEQVEAIVKTSGGYDNDRDAVSFFMSSRIAKALPDVERQGRRLKVKALQEEIEALTDQD